MGKKQLSKPRRYFRYSLYGLMTVSFLFFATIVFLRVNHDAQKVITHNPEYREYVFHYDVFQHQVRAFFSDQQGEFEIALSLSKKGIFSPVYGEAGYEMLQNLAEEEYLPAVVVFNTFKERKKRTAEQNKKVKERVFAFLLQKYDRNVVEEKMALLPPLPEH